MHPTRSRAQIGRFALTILCIALSATGCGVSKAKYLGMTKSRDELTVKSAQLQSSLDTANQEKATLTSEKAALDARVKEMESASQQLGTQLQDQQRTTAEVQSTYEAMVGRLKSDLSSGKVEVEQMRDGINVNLAQDILFRSGSADLDKAGRTLLLKVAEELKSSAFQVIVTGNTDNQKIGVALASRFPSNWELGGARASSIVRLFEGAGLDKARLAAVSFADSRPREANDTPAGRAKNRRIEIKLRPTAGTATAGQ